MLMPLIISGCVPLLTISFMSVFDIACFRHGHHDNQVLQEEMQHDTRVVEEREQHMRQLEVTVCVLCHLCADLPCAMTSLFGLCSLFIKLISYVF